MNENFYRAYEDRHRGPREMIKERLKCYLPFIEPWKTLQKNSRALDLGCGRGEWLELIGDNGFKAKGVDLDEGMLENCKSLNLNAQLKDALAAIKEAGDSSLSIVSGFHIAEHIPFDVLQDIIKESLRALKPSGLLILETPNAENISVGSHHFYQDPTHQRPLPAELLSFVADHAGFARSKILRLNESKEVASGQHSTLDAVLRGVSPDCAIVAQKSDKAARLKLFDKAFNRDYGVSLEQMTERFQNKLEEMMTHTEEQKQLIAENAVLNHKIEERDLNAKENNLKIEKLNLEITDLNAEVADLNRHLDTEKAEAERKLSEIHEHYEWAEKERQRLELHNQDLQASLSWRITAPIRCFKTLFVSFILSFIKVPLRPLARLLIRFTKRSPKIRLFATRILNRFPGIKHRIQAFMAHNSLGGPVPNPAYEHSGEFGPLDEPESSKKHIENASNLSETERFLKSEL